MPAKDVFHDTVRNALEKERWTITDDPLFIKSLGIDFYVDLAVPKDTYETFFRIQFVQAAVGEYRIALMVFDPEKEAIVTWQT